MIHRLLRAVALGCAIAAVFITAALAQSGGDIVAAVCSPQAQSLAIWALGIVGVGSLLTWSRRVMNTLPRPVQHAINFLALNWRQIAVDAKIVAPMAALIVTAAVLTACSGTSVSVAPLNPADAQLMFKNACAGISTANGMFQADAPALIVAGKLTQAQIDQEKTIFAVASGRCDNPPVDATGAINYQALAIDTAGDAATVYLLLHGAP
jgi:hypothetical protein